VVLGGLLESPSGAEGHRFESCPSTGSGHPEPVEGCRAHHPSRWFGVFAVLPSLRLASDPINESAPVLLQGEWRHCSRADPPNALFQRRSWAKAR